MRWRHSADDGDVQPSPRSFYSADMRKQPSPPPSARSPRMAPTAQGGFGLALADSAGLDFGRDAAGFPRLAPWTPCARQLQAGIGGPVDRSFSPELRRAYASSATASRYLGAVDAESSHVGEMELRMRAERQALEEQSRRRTDALARQRQALQDREAALMRARRENDRRGAALRSMGERIRRQEAALFRSRRDANAEATQVWETSLALETALRSRRSNASHLHRDEHPGHGSDRRAPWKRLASARSSDRRSTARSTHRLSGIEETQFENSDEEDEHAADSGNEGCVSGSDEAQSPRGSKIDQSDDKKAKDRGSARASRARKSRKTAKKTREDDAIKEASTSNDERSAEKTSEDDESERESASEVSAHTRNGSSIVERGKPVRRVRGSLHDMVSQSVEKMRVEIARSQTDMKRMLKDIVSAQADRKNKSSGKDPRRIVGDDEAYLSTFATERNIADIVARELADSEEYRRAELQGMILQAVKTLRNETEQSLQALQRGLQQDIAHRMRETSTLQGKRGPVEEREIEQIVTRELADTERWRRAELQGMVLQTVETLRNEAEQSIDSVVNSFVRKFDAAEDTRRAELEAAIAKAVDILRTEVDASAAATEERVHDIVQQALGEQKVGEQNNQARRESSLQAIHRVVNGILSRNTVTASHDDEDYAAVDADVLSQTVKKLRPEKDTPKWNLKQTIQNAIGQHEVADEEVQRRVLQKTREALDGGQSEVYMSPSTIRGIVERVVTQELHDSEQARRREVQDAILQTVESLQPALQEKANASSLTEERFRRVFAEGEVAQQDAMGLPEDRLKLDDEEEDLEVRVRRLRSEILSLEDAVDAPGVARGTQAALVQRLRAKRGELQRLTTSEEASSWISLPPSESSRGTSSPLRGPSTYDGASAIASVSGRGGSLVASSPRSAATPCSSPGRSPSPVPSPRGPSPQTSPQPLAWQVAVAREGAERPLSVSFCEDAFAESEDEEEEASHHSVGSLSAFQDGSHRLGAGLDYPQPRTVTTPSPVESSPQPALVPAVAWVVSLDDSGSPPAPRGMRQPELGAAQQSPVVSPGRGAAEAARQRGHRAREAADRARLLEEARTQRRAEQARLGPAARLLAGVR
eukprot:TRINITY_DN54905_c0_g1_i1.p1 TRINITY_DN54905_c0_g1~~TRINITY_DN54905_c0_g1_i1.p1  ORF type:complete len:1109 (-),score=203.83 TRINITY_DN54905_c0_g1_i1:93-3419(-)